MLIALSALPFVVAPPLLLYPQLDSGVITGDIEAVDFTQSNGDNGRPGGVVKAWGNGFLAGSIFEEFWDPGAVWK